MTTHPILPIFVDAWDGATAHLTPAEEGLYWRLIRLAWQTPGCSLPVDPQWLARKIRLTPSEFQTLAQPILAEFFSVTKGRFVQKRLTKEFEYVTALKSARKEAGKKGGLAKAQKEKENDPSKATVLLRQPIPTPISKDSTEAGIGSELSESPYDETENIIPIAARRPRLVSVTSPAAEPKKYEGEYD